MSIQVGNTDIQQILQDGQIGLGNQFNPIELIISGGGSSNNIWSRSSGTILPITITDKVGLGTSTFIGSERLRVSGETNTDTLRTQTGYLDSLRLRNITNYLAITAPVSTGRTVTFQDKDGVVALLSDTQSLPNYTLVSTYTNSNSSISNAVTYAHTHTNKSLLDTYNQINSDITLAVSYKHQHGNKVLLDTYTNSNTDISSAISNNHSHSNKLLLDTYNQTNVNITLAITNQHTHVNKTLLDSYSNINSDITLAITNAHTHSNKSLLDSYTQTEIDLADAVTKKHSHSNLGLLESYTQSNANIIISITNTHTHINKSILDSIINSGSGTTFLSDAGDYRSVTTAPVGTDTQVVFNDGGTTLNGDSGLVFNKTTNLLTAGILQTSSILNVVNTSTYISKNVGGDISFTDINSGTVSLATLVIGNTNYWSPITGGISYTNYVGINTPPSLDEALTVNGNIQANDFNSSYIRYKNSNILIGPNAGDLETGNNKVYIANTDTSTPLFYGEIDNQLAAFYADVYIYGAKTLNFGSAVNRIYWTSGNNLTFQDANADSGNAISLSDLRDGTYYSLVGAFTDYNAVKSITTANKSTWNKASILITSGDGTKYLGNDGVYYTAASGGVTPTDNFTKWDTGSSYYRYYTSKTEAGGGSSGGKLYLGTIDPTNTNRLNYDGALHAFQFEAFASGSANAIRGDSSSNGIGIQATSNSGIAFSAISNSNIGAIINIGSGSSSDIAKFQKNAVDQVVINSFGINLITGATYKINGVDLSYLSVGAEASLGNPGTNGYILSSTTTGTRSWVSPLPAIISDIFDWSTNKYTPYTTQGDGHFDSGTVAPIHTTRLNYDGNLYSNKFLASNSVVVSLTGNTGILDSNGYLMLDSNGYIIIDSTQSSIYDAISTLGATSLDITINGTSKTLYSPGVTDGTTAVAYISDTVNSLAAAGAKLRSDRNNGVEKFSIDKDGNVNIPTGANYKINGVSIASGTPIDGIFHWDGTAYNPYSTQTIGKFDNSSTHPTDTSIHLNFNGQFWVTNIISGTTSSAVTAFNGYSDTASGGYFQTNSNFGCQGIALTSGTGVLGTSKTGKAGWFANDGSTTSSSSILYINKTGGGSINLTGDLIGIVDNPSTSGTISGSTLKATIDSTIRIDMNPRVTNSSIAVAYVWDTANSLSNASAKLHSFSNSGTLQSYISGTGTYFAGDGVTNFTELDKGHIYTKVSGNFRTQLFPTVTDSSSAVAYLFDTSTTLSNITAKLTSWKNNGTEKSNIDYKGTNNSIHFGGLSSTPTIVVGTGAGTSPTISITGTDTGFRVTLTTGTLPTSGGDICTVTFNIPYTTIPYAIHAAKSNYAGINSMNVINTTTTTTLKLININSALQGSVSYIWDILIIQ